MQVCLCIAAILEVISEPTRQSDRSEIVCLIALETQQELTFPGYSIQVDLRVIYTEVHSSTSLQLRAVQSFLYRPFAFLPQTFHLMVRNP